MIKNPKTLLIVVLLLLKSINGFSKADSFAMSEHIFIATAQKKVNIGDITKKNISKLLGKPAKIKKEMTETDGLLTVYSYRDGEVDFDENGYLNSIEIKNAGWAMILKTKNKSEKAFSFNSTDKDLYTYFKGSLNKNSPGFADIHLQSKSGEIDPYTWIVFRMSKGHISSILYAFNNF